MKAKIKIDIPASEMYFSLASFSSNNKKKTVSTHYDQWDHDAKNDIYFDHRQLLTEVNNIKTQWPYIMGY